MIRCTRNQKSDLIIACLIFIWLAVIIFNYLNNYKIDLSVFNWGLFQFFEEKWDCPQLLTVFLTHIYSILLTVLFLFSSLVIGSRFFKDKLLAICFGIGILGYLVFFLGVFKLLYPVYILLAWFFVLMGTVPLFSTEKRGLSLLKEFRELKEEFKGNQILFFTIIFLVFSSVIINFMGSIVPEIFYDSLFYHLGIPQLYLLNHKIFNIRTNIFSNYPSLTEMVYTLAISIGGDGFAKLINFSVSVLSIIVIYLISAKLFDRKTGIFAILIFYTVPMVSTLSWTTSNDLFAMLFVLVAFYSFISGFNTIVVGVFVGLALSCKLTTVFFIPAFLVLFLLEIGTVPLFSKEKRGLSLLFIVFLMVSPWLIRNILYTGNPVFPYLRDLFAGIPINESSFNILIQEQRDIKIHNFIDLLKFPWDLTMNVPSFGRYLIGPMFLFLVPIVFIFMRFFASFRMTEYIDKQNSIKYLTLFFVFGLFAWILVSNLSRFFIVGFAILSIILAYTISKIGTVPKQELSQFLSTIILFGVVIISIINIFWSFYLLNFYFKPFPVLLGVQTREEYMQEEKSVMPNYDQLCFDYINTNLSENSKILFVGETRGFECKRNFVVTSAFDINPFIDSLKKYDTEMQIYDYLKRNKYSHILINFREVYRINSTYKVFDLSSREMELYDKFIKKYTRIIFENNNTFLFEII